MGSVSAPAHNRPAFDPTQRASRGVSQISPAKSSAPVGNPKPLLVYHSFRANFGTLGVLMPSAPKERPSSRAAV